MAPIRNTFRGQCAIALTSIALALSICLGGIPHASADPYDADDTTEVITSDPGFDASSDWGQDDGGYAEPDPEPQDWGSETDLQPTFDEPAPDQPDDDGAGAEVEAPSDSTDDPGYSNQPAEPATGEAPEVISQPGVDASGMDAAQDEDQSDLDLDAGSDPSDLADQSGTADLDAAEADLNDVDLALSAVPVTAEPAAAVSSEVDEIREALTTEITSTSTMTESSWSSSVTLWNSSWLGYDTYYRPIVTNPYHYPLQLIYGYGDTTRIVNVAPLQRAVFAVPTPGVYNFTALTRTDSGAVATVSVGSFTGGGYVPATGQPPPPKPQAPNTFKNALVQIRYSNGVSKPFRVKLLTDLGDDPAVGGHRALLDEETPAWGQWTKTQSGARLFQISKTQQLPGLTAPAEAPLPGYDVQLANKEGAQPNSSDQTALIIAVAAVACGALGLAATGFVAISGRRRKADTPS